MSSNLFQPLRVGTVTLDHRIVMAPLTRLRADDEHVQLPIAVEYYSQRASVPGTLIITKATLISPAHSGFPYAPGLWTSAQIAGWKLITNAVHARECSIFAQLVASGRAAALDSQYPLLSLSLECKAYEVGGRCRPARDNLRSNSVLHCRI
jgi:NADPH2 dehydrogenase